MTDNETHDLQNEANGRRSEVQRLKLGDQVERMLAGIGITKDRYAEIKKQFGLPPTCNCAKRQQWLNQVSDWWHQIMPK